MQIALSAKIALSVVSLMNQSGVKQELSDYKGSLMSKVKGAIEGIRRIVLCSFSSLPVSTHFAHGSLFVVSSRADGVRAVVDTQIEHEGKTLRVHVEAPRVASLDEIELSTDGDLRADFDGHEVHFPVCLFKDLGISVEQDLVAQNASTEDVCYCRVPGCRRRTMAKYRMGDADKWTPLCGEHCFRLLL